MFTCLFSSVLMMTKNGEKNGLYIYFRFKFLYFFHIFMFLLACFYIQLINLNALFSVGGLSFLTHSICVYVYLFVFYWKRDFLTRTKTLREIFVDLIFINMAFDIIPARECFKILYLDGRFLFIHFQGLCELVLLIWKTFMVHPIGKEQSIAKSAQK